MSERVVIDNIDITSYLIGYSREDNICNSTGSVNISITGDYSNYIHMDSEIIVYEDGNRVGTYNINSITNSTPDYTIAIAGTNGSDKLNNTMIAEMYKLSENPTLKTRYWIELFMGMAGVSYEFTVDTDGEYLPNDQILGHGSMVMDEVVKLLQYSGWFMRFNEYNTVVIGNLDYSSDEYQELVNNSRILNIKTVENDSFLRNRIIVWGMGGTTVSGYIFADVSVRTPWNYDEKDLRTAVISNAYIVDTETAYGIANKALKEFTKPTYIKTVQITGYVDVHIGDRAGIQSNTINTICTITTMAVNMGMGGRTTTLTLDERCPRLIGYLNFGGYVNIGTTGQGIWRKHIRYDHTWENFSTGLYDLNIKDIHIAGGSYVCVTASGQLYYIDSAAGDTYWKKIQPPTLPDPIHSGYYYSGDSVICVAATINPNNGEIVAGYNLYDDIYMWSGGPTKAAVGSYISNIRNGVPYQNTYFSTTNSGFKNSSLLVSDLDNNGRNTYISSTGVPGSVYSSLNTVSNISYLPFKINTTEFLDNSNLTVREDIFNDSITGIEDAAIYGHMLYAVSGDRVSVHNLKNNTSSTKSIIDGWTGVNPRRIDPLNANRCCVTHRAGDNGTIHFVIMDFSDFHNVTRTYKTVTLPHLATFDPKIYIYCAYNRKGNRVIIVVYPDNVSISDPKGLTCFRYMLYTPDKDLVSYGVIDLPEFSKDIPENPLYADRGTLITMNGGSKNQYSIPIYITKAWNRRPHNDSDPILFDVDATGVMGLLDVDYGFTSLYIVPEEIGVAYKTLSNDGDSVMRVVGKEDNFAVYMSQHGLDIEECRANAHDYTMGVREVSIISDNSTYESLYPSWDTSSDQAAWKHVTDRTTTNSSSIYNYNIRDNTSAYLLNELPDPIYSREIEFYTNNINDYDGKFLTTKVVETVYPYDYSGIFEDDGNRILTNAKIKNPIGYPTPRNFWLLGGIILYEDYYQRYGVIFSNIISGEVCELYRMENQNFNLVGLLPNPYMKVDTSKDLPIVTFGGEENYNQSDFDFSWDGQNLAGFNNLLYNPDPGINFVVASGISGSISTGANYISDYRTADIITSSGNTRVGLIAQRAITTNGISYIRQLQYDTINKTTTYDNYWRSFSGYITKLETTNGQDHPFIFVATCDSITCTGSGIPVIGGGIAPFTGSSIILSGWHFYQKDGYNTGAIVSDMFIDRTYTLPPISGISVIRCDEII